MFNSNNKQINMVGLQGSTIHYSNSESLPRLDNEGRDLDPPAVDFDLAALGLEFSESNFAFFLEETADFDTAGFDAADSTPALDLEAEGRDLDPPAVDFDLAALGLEFSESNFAFLLEETAALGAACCISANLDFLFDDSTDLANFDAVGFDAVELTPAVVLEADSRA
jgi:hypothetical protein